PVNRRLIQAPFAGDPARVLGLALPLSLGQFGQPLLEDQAVLLGELFDAVEDLANGLTHVTASSQLLRCGSSHRAYRTENHSRRNRLTDQENRFSTPIFLHFGVPIRE